jgi:HAD superfamily hydrolase (TIGR01490 family)
MNAVVAPSSTSSPRRAAFFDMDNTVLRISTGTSWMKFLYRRGELSRLGMARAVYWSALYELAVLDMEALARRLVADLAGEPEAELIAKSEVWHRADVASEVAPRAIVAIERHRRRGDLVVLLTGSTQYASEAVARGLAIEHTLCSRLEVVDGRFTGRLAQMCFGEHKVVLAERFAAEHGVDLARSWFYSDSFNDLPMLERVGTAVAINPDARLHRHARRRGWRIDQWA